MAFTALLNWQMIIAICLMIASTLSKFIPALLVKGRSVPVWYGFMAVNLAYLLIFNFISLVGVTAVLLLILACVYMDTKRTNWLRYLSGSVAVLLFLALGFKAVPGFNNPLLVDGQFLKGESTAFFKSYNFDKTFAGLVFFLLLVPASHSLTLKTLIRAIAIAVITTIIVLGGGAAAGLIDFNFDYHFSFTFLAFFLTIQIFSVCLAEEVFFRGFIQERLARLFRPQSLCQKLIPLLVASSLFGLVHFGGGLGYVIAATFAGIGYGLVFQITKRIEAAILAHTFLNLIHLLFFTYPFAT